MDLDDYPPYSETFLNVFETKISSNIKCIHVNPNSSKHKKKKAQVNK